MAIRERVVQSFNELHGEVFGAIILEIEDGSETREVVRRDIGGVKKKVQPVGNLLDRGRGGVNRGHTSKEGDDESGEVVLVFDVLTLSIDGSGIVSGDAFELIHPL